MLDWKEYILTARRGSWPAGEGLVLDPVSGDQIAVIREELWPEVLERPWPDGVQGRPWLWRLLGVERNPRQSRTVVRRNHDGRPLIRLHYRQPLFGKTVGIFDDEDHRVGYVRWSFKGTGARDEFDLVRVDQRMFAEVYRTTADVYRVAEKDGREWGMVTVSRSEGGAETPVECRVSSTEEALDGGKDGVFLMAAALILLLQG